MSQIRARKLALAGQMQAFASLQTALQTAKRISAGVEGKIE